MKKKYVNPEFQIHYIKTEKMLASSPNNGNNHGNGNSEHGNEGQHNGWDKGHGNGNGNGNGHGKNGVDEFGNLW